MRFVAVALLAGLALAGCKKNKSSYDIIGPSAQVLPTPNRPTVIAGPEPVVSFRTGDHNLTG